MPEVQAFPRIKLMIRIRRTKVVIPVYSLSPSRTNTQMEIATRSTGVRMRRINPAVMTA